MVVLPIVASNNGRRARQLDQHPAFLALSSFIALFVYNLCIEGGDRLVATVQFFIEPM